MKPSMTFHNPQYGHNCAQAVAYKNVRLFPDESVVAEYKAYGGGRAEGGVCGALYAAMQALPEKADEIKARFTERVGDWRCKEIKQRMQTPCAECCDIADEVLNAVIAEG